MKIPTIQEVQAYANELARIHGCDPFGAREFVQHYSEQGWKRADGLEMTRWQSAAVWWTLHGKPRPLAAVEEEIEDLERKMRFYQGAMFMQDCLGYKPGWVFWNYVERFGEHPPKRWRWELRPQEPLQEDFEWMFWRYKQYTIEMMRPLEDENPIPNNVIPFRRKA